MSRRSWAAVIGLLIAYALLGHRYLAYWQSDATLWPYAAAITPNNPLPVANAQIVRHMGSRVESGFVFEDPIWTAACAPSPNPVPMSAGLRGVPRWLAQQSWCWQLGQPAWAFHLVNLLLHGLVACLLGWLIYRLTRSEATAWSVGALFLLHPLVVESAGYGAGRGELLAGVGVLLTCLAALAGAWILAPFALLFGLLGKETAIVAVMLVPWLLVYQRQGSAMLAVIVSGVVLGSIGAATFLFETWPASWRIGWALLQATAFVRLTLLGLVPWGQTPTHDYTQVPLFLQGLSLLLVLALGIVAWRWTNRLGALGLAWLLVTMAPRLLVPTPYSVFNEHQFYVPLMGLGLIAASVLVPAHAHANRR